MDLGLKGKVAIVTGGTQGIGKAAALLFAREGASVVIAARRQELLDAVAGEIRVAGGKVAAVRADIGDKADCERLMAEAVKAFGRVDILVNNAGTSQTGEFQSVTDETWQADFDLKLFGAIRLARLAIPQMKKQGGGRIINITNIGAKQPRAKSMPTTVTRAAGLAFTKALSKEFAPDNILVNTICIGKIKSGQHERRYTKDGISAEEYYGKLGKDIPMKRAGEAQEVANVITFLVSDAASYVTGTILFVDGGWLANDGRFTPPGM